MSQYLTNWQPLTVYWRLKLLFTLKISLFSGYSNKILASIIQCIVTTIEKFRYIVFQKQVVIATQKILYSAKYARLSEILVK